MTKPIFDWLMPAWQRLLAQRARLPHALLIHGRAGLGKTVLARLFAQRLLCEGNAGEFPCGECGSCLWFSQGNHPDFRQVEPEALTQAAVAVDNPRAEKETVSRQIKIDQIREIQDFLAIGTHRRGLRIVLLRPAEAMNAPTANALLKSLEEPTPATLFLLISSAPERLLPTVRSRCQPIAVGAASDETARAYLAEQGLKDPAQALAYASRAPLAAVEAEAERSAREALIGQLSMPHPVVFDLADACHGLAPSTVVRWLQRWAYDLALVKLTGRVRFHVRQAPALTTLASTLAAEPLLRFERSLAEDMAVAEHPLNPRLFLESVLLRYTQLWGERPHVG
jgi:DNA polymerase III subunit delta'